MACWRPRDPVTGLRDDLPQIPRYLAVSILASGVFAGVASVIAASTPRRAYATATIIGAFILPPIVVAVIDNLAGRPTWPESSTSPARATSSRA